MMDLTSKSTLAILAVISAILIIIVDYFLGEIAEFFNAYYMLLYLFDWVPGVPKLEHNYVMNQDELGIFAIPVALIIYIAEIAVVSLLLLGILFGMDKIRS